MQFFIQPNYIFNFNRFSEWYSLILFRLQTMSQFPGYTGFDIGEHTTRISDFVRTGEIREYTICRPIC